MDDKKEGFSEGNIKLDEISTGIWHKWKAEHKDKPELPSALYPVSIVKSGLTASLEMLESLRPKELQGRDKAYLKFVREHDGIWGAWCSKDKKTIEEIVNFECADSITEQCDKVTGLTHQQNKTLSNYITGHILTNGLDIPGLYTTEYLGRFFVLLKWHPPA